MWLAGAKLNRSDVFLLTADFSDMGESYFDAVSGLDADKAYEFIRNNGTAKEAVVLHTCNRFEVYFYPGTYETLNAFHEFFRGKLKHYRVVHGDESLRHLFEVAAGLRSMVTGEDEILGQIREAWANSKEYGMNGPAVDEMFGKAVEVGRAIRSSTGIGRVRRSVSREAVEIYLEKGANDPVLVIGAGNMGKKIARLLREQGLRVSITNRTGATSLQFAQDAGIECVPFDIGHWKGFRSIFVAIRKSEPLLRSEDLEDMGASLVVDVSVPGVVQAPSGRLPEVVTMAQLSERVDEFNHLRNDLAEAARSMLNDELKRYIDFRNDSRREELLKKLYLYTEGLVAEQLSEIARRTALDEEQKRIVEKGLLSQRSKILSLIVQSMKSSEDVWNSDFVIEMERMLEDSGQTK